MLSAQFVQSQSRAYAVVLEKDYGDLYHIIRIVGIRRYQDLVLSGNFLKKKSFKIRIIVIADLREEVSVRRGDCSRKYVTS